jgi:Protein of unknown function (DUF3575)
MKKLLFLILLYFPVANAQQTTISDKKNEVHFDVLSLITASKFNISYERFINKRLSSGVTFAFSDSNKINDDFDKGFRNNVPKYEVIPYVRYNLSKGLTRFYFAEIFANVNGGDFKEIVRLTDNNIDYYTTQKSNYSDVALGGSLGYKMYFNEKFALEFLVGVGRNIANTAKSPDYISRVGLNFGYRF